MDEVGPFWRVSKIKEIMKCWQIRSWMASWPFSRHSVLLPERLPAGDRHNP